MKEQCPLAVSMALKGEKFRNSLSVGMTQREELNFKSLGPLLGIDACLRVMQLNLSKFKVSPIKTVQKSLV